MMHNLSPFSDINVTKRRSSGYKSQFKCNKQKYLTGELVQNGTKTGGLNVNITACQLFMKQTLK